MASPDNDVQQDAKGILVSIRERAMFSPSSKVRLTDRDLQRFPGESLFDRLAHAVCHAGCLPRKELYEAWEMARRVRRMFRGGRVVDLAAGHGLLAHVLMILDNSSPQALVVDTTLPKSSRRFTRRSSTRGRGWMAGCCSRTPDRVGRPVRG